MKRPGDHPDRAPDAKLEQQVIRRALQAEFLDRILSNQTDRQALNALKLGVTTLERWIRKYPDFRARYEGARIQVAHGLADDILTIADAPLIEGDAAHQGIELDHRRVRIDVRKWLASKRAPRQYGPRPYDERKIIGGVVILPAIQAREAARQAPINAANDALVDKRIRKLFPKTPPTDDVTDDPPDDLSDTDPSTEPS